MARDLPEAEEHCEAALVLFATLGARRNEAFAAGNLMYVMILSGRLEEAPSASDPESSKRVASDLPGTPLLYEGLGHFSRRSAAIRRLLGPVLSACRAWRRRARSSSPRGIRGSRGGGGPCGGLTWIVADGGAPGCGSGARSSHADCDRRIAHRGCRRNRGRSFDPDLEAAQALVSRLDARPIGELPRFVRAQLKRYAGLRLAETATCLARTRSLPGPRRCSRT